MGAAMKAVIGEDAGRHAYVPARMVMLGGATPRGEMLRAMLALVGSPCVSLPRAEEATAADWFVVDLGEDGWDERLDRLARCRPGARVLLVDTDGAAQGIVRDDLELRTLSGPLRHRTLRAALDDDRVMDPDPRAPALIGRSAAISGLRRMVERVARTDATVLVLGETGTGKEVVARNIHYASPRADGPFVAVNCGAIPHDLLESELFGHEKGAFTGAVSARKGRFELARGGTIFLDEIGDMPMAMQVKLLRVLQERTFEPVGSGRSVEADVRIVAATHRDLEAAIEAGDFREDLYYRLSVFPIQTPALRDHPEDLPQLVAELVERLERRGADTVAITEAAMAHLKANEWRGNVRELANFVERLTIIHPDGLVDVADLPPRYRSDAAIASQDLHGEARREAQVELPEQGIDLRGHLTSIEARLIVQALERTRGTVAHAAELLEIRRTTLIEKIRKYGIEECAADGARRWVARGCPDVVTA
ncbi:MAG: sigma-54 dependent transcriptional regulator [Pseudomonadales bacterium]|jgi:sigma-54 specific flagellar transcriptional regulator A|nr:sigma-54 dependent transcriptional regulator [Pseudomonadales bacterium]